MDSGISRNGASHAPENQRAGSLWTAERDMHLAELWSAGVTTAVIGAAMGVTKNAVIGRAHRLGLSRRLGALAQHRPWSAEDDSTLCAMWPDLRLRRALPKTLGRSTKAIRHRAKVLKILFELPAAPHPTRGLQQAARRAHESLARRASTSAPNNAEMGAPALRRSGPAIPTASVAVTRATRVGATTCRYPLWGDQERPTHRYCTEPPARRSYCWAHAALCYVEPTSVLKAP